MVKDFDQRYDWASHEQTENSAGAWQEVWESINLITLQAGEVRWLEIDVDKSYKESRRKEN